MKIIVDSEMLERALKCLQGVANGDYDGNATQHADELRAAIELAEALPVAPVADKDAERYRWLREQGYGGWAICRWDSGAGDYFRCILPHEQIDAAIDAAMAKGE